MVLSRSWRFVAKELGARMHAGGWWLLVAMAEIGVLLLLEFTGGRSVANLSAGFAIAALTAAIGVGPRTVAAVGAVATAAAVGSGFRVSLSAEAWTVRTGFVVAGSVIGIVAALNRVSREARLGRTIRLVEAAQGVMLRPPPVRLGTYGLAARYVAATTEVNLGGDFYDVAFHPSGAVVALVGDVKGHGFDAVESAAHTLAAFRLAVFASDGPEQLAGYLDLDISPALEEEEFVTALVIWLLADGTASVISLGHPAPWLVSASGLRRVDELQPSPPLGLPQRPVASPLVLGEADILVAYTDGLVEARDRSGQFFPAELALQARQGTAPSELLEALMTEVTEFSGGFLADDIALLAIQYLPTRVPAAVQIDLTTEDADPSPTKGVDCEGQLWIDAPGLAMPAMTLRPTLMLQPD